MQNGIMHSRCAWDKQLTHKVTEFTEPKDRNQLECILSRGQEMRRMSKTSTQIGVYKLENWFQLQLKVWTKFDYTAY